MRILIECAYFLGLAIVMSYISITLYNFQRHFSIYWFIWFLQQLCEPHEDDTIILKMIKVTTGEAKGLLKGHTDY